MKYVANDGREFDSEKECLEYENKLRPTKAIEYCWRKINKLIDARFDHKHGRGEDYGTHSTQYTGRTHQFMLRSYRESLEKGQFQGESQSSWFARIGHLASEMIKWRNAEKAAGENLKQIRENIKRYTWCMKMLQHGEPEPVWLFAERVGFKPLK